MPPNRRFELNRYVAIEVVVEVLDVAAYILAFYAIVSTNIQPLIDDHAKQDRALVPDTELLNKETDILIDSLQSSRNMAIAAMVLVCIAFVLRTIVRRVL
jgi:hypothetical protein